MMIILFIFCVFNFHVCRITQVGGPKSGSKFYEGRNAITYKATDTEGATDYCVKYVTIKGNDKYDPLCITHFG